MKQLVSGGLLVAVFVWTIGLRVLYRRGMLSFEVSIGLGVILLGILVIYDLMENSWLRRLKKALKRIQQNEDHALLKEYQRRRARGDRSFTTTIALSTVYARLGQGAQAEQLAREAGDTAEQAGDLKGTGQGARARRLLTMLTVQDAIVVQGRFGEAAQGMLDYLPNAEDQAEIAAFAAWYFFMGQQEDRVRQLLQTYYPQLAAGQFQVNLKSEKYRFILLYLAHKVLGLDTRQSLLQLRPQLLRLESEANLAGKSPYAARLHDILRDMSYVMGLSSDVIRPLV